MNSLKKYIRYATNTTSEFTQDSEFRQVMDNINENINSATGLQDGSLRDIKSHRKQNRDNESDLVS